MTPPPPNGQSNSLLSTLPGADTGVLPDCKVFLCSLISLVVCGCTAVVVVVAAAVVVVVVVEMVFLFGAVVGFTFFFTVHGLLLTILVTGKCGIDTKIRI